MENTDQIHSFIRLVMNENLAQAQSVIREALNTKLSEALDEKFEAYAPAIFEEFDAKKADKNDDGTLSDWEENSTEWAKEDGDEEGDEEGEEEGEEDMSDRQLQSDENFQDLPSDERMSRRYGIRSTQYPGTAGSDGY